MFDGEKWIKEKYSEEIQEARAGIGCEAGGVWNAEVLLSNNA